MTAILDFDWAHVACVADEFFRSFGNIEGRLPGPYCNEPGQLDLRKALLDGFPDPLPLSESDVKWEVAKIWDEELAQKDVQRPRTIRGIAALSGVYWLSEQICPFLLCNEAVFKHRTTKQSEKDREEAEKLLINYLEGYGL